MPTEENNSADDKTETLRPEFASGRDEEAEILLRLPDDVRDQFKEPLGTILTDAAEVNAVKGSPLFTVGDVVTAHLERSGTHPDLAVIDGRSEREPLDEAVVADLHTPDVTVVNPPATITRELLSALDWAIDSTDAVTIFVDGEEDLATIPVMLRAPKGASVVYGQPGQGMVHLSVNDEVRERANSLLALFEGDQEIALSVLGMGSS